MSSLITCGGLDVQSGQIHMGIGGPWWADLQVAADDLPSGRVAIKADGGLSLEGTVITAGAYNLTTKVRVVGGAGGLGVEVLGAFQGAQLRDPLSEIMRASGETQSTTIAAAVLSVPLPSWTLGKCSAKRALDQLATAASQYLGQAIGWRVLPDGTVWLGSESWPAAELPDGAVISQNTPAAGRAVIGGATLFLAPGVDLEGIGRIAGVDHDITPHGLSSTAWSAAQLDPIDKLAQAVFEHLGIAYPGAPVLDRLALYRARVDAAASDGSTVDVTPESARLSPMQKVRMRHGPAVGSVKVGAAVLIGWEAGDVGRVYARPDYEAGAAFSNVDLVADLVNLGAAGGSKVATKADLDAIKAAISGAAVVANDGGAALKANIIAAWPASVGSSKVKAAL